MTDTLPVRRALLSVSDKTGIVPFASFLSGLGVELVSTGGTARALREAGLAVRDVAELSGFPEILDGRVKTLAPQVHGGLLARRDDPAHMASLAAHGIGPIDLLAVNLYPFETAVAEGKGFDECVENIDIGGPALIRAAAKNHAFVAVLTAPDHLSEVRAELAEKGGTTLATRRRLAAEAFARTAAYDAAIARWFAAANGVLFPPRAAFAATLAQTLRYGENPHQEAAFYRTDDRPGVATARQVQGKELSYNNIADTDAAYECVAEFEQPAIVIVKHTNPCGVATRDDLLEAYRLAVRADATSAFGGIVAFNRVVDEALAREIREFRSPNDGETRMFYEIVIAPGYTPEGLATLKGKSKDLRILEAQPRARGGLAIRQVGGGWLVQDPDDLPADEVEFRVVTQRQPTPQQLEDLRFAWRVVKHVKSNAIVVAKDGRLLGMGSGQPNRVKSVEIAMEKAGEEVRGAVLASDAFFPFAWNDSIEKACQAGIAAIAHPGGALRDQDGIDCCNQYGVAMAFTSVRHFRH